MRRLLPVAAALILITGKVALYAQGVGINTTGLPADTSAILDVSSTSKGFLPPRMTAAQRAAITLPATGLVVYQTDGTPGFFYNAGTVASPNWRRLLDSANVTGSQWTTNGSNIYYGSGNVGIGTASPITSLDVRGALNLQDAGNAGTLYFPSSLHFKWGTPSLSSERLSLNGSTGYLGIGTTTPDAPLSFPPSLGKKITLYPGLTGDVGFAVQGNLFQMYSDNPSADIAFGYDQSGTMTELMRIKANGNVGIGTTTPNAPLSFAPTLTHKITLYPGATGDVGFGVAANRLQIYSDNPNADVAIGYDAAGTFNERFAVKPNGAVAVNQSVGSPGQVLQSNGGGSTATWTSPTNALFNSTNVVYSTGPGVLVHDNGVPNQPSLPIPGMSSTFTLTSTAKVCVTYTVSIITESCAFCGDTHTYVDIQIDGALVSRFPNDLGNGASVMSSASNMFTLGAGTHTVSLAATIVGPDTHFGEANSLLPCPMIIQIIPQ